MTSPRVESVTALNPYVVRVRFEDGQVRDVDIAPLLEGIVFAPLRDPAAFARVHADEQTGAVAWPNGTDLDPDVIYGGDSPSRQPAARVTTPQTA